MPRRRPDTQLASGCGERVGENQSPLFVCSFNTLIFGENKPLMGFCRDGQLDLIYYRDPGLKEGQSFPLWTIQ